MTPLVAISAVRLYGGPTDLCSADVNLEGCALESWHVWCFRRGHEVTALVGAVLVCGVSGLRSARGDQARRTAGGRRVREGPRRAVRARGPDRGPGGGGGGANLARRRGAGRTG